MLDDIRNCPGTMGLAGTWVLVFALILLVQWRGPAQGRMIPVVEPLPHLTATTHRFGDLTLSEVHRGQVWRLVTATFVHYSLLHLGMNVMSLVMLGRLVEPWYGAGPFLGVCLTIGGLGNLVGGLLRLLVAWARPWVAATNLVKLWPGLAEGGIAGPIEHTGGGSTILLGLLGLAAVVGWRSRTRIGGYLARQMVVLLGFTAILGIVFSNLIDNYGHAGGAIVGAALGFVHRPMVRASERRPVRRLSWTLVGVLSASCLVAAVRADLVESALERRLVEVVTRCRMAEQVQLDLARLRDLFGRSIARSEWVRDPYRELDAWAVADLLGRNPGLGEAAGPAEVARERAETLAIADRLGEVPARALWGDAVAAELGEIRELARLSVDEAPRYEEIYEFVVAAREVLKAASADLARSKGRLVELSRAAR